MDVHADMEFECVLNDFALTRVNLTPRDAHVGKVERSIRTIKERVRADIHSLPFRRLPKMIVIELVRRAVRLLNQFPALDGVSETMSPTTIMTGIPPMDYNHLTVDFGSYALVFEDNDPTNTTKARSTGAIALNPTGNTEGDYHFMSLLTGHHLARRQWTSVPMPDSVIATVEARVELEGQPLLVGNCPVFEWTHNMPIIDEDIDDGDVGDDPNGLNGNVDVAPADVFFDPPVEGHQGDEEASDDDTVDVDVEGPAADAPVPDVSDEESETDASVPIEEEDSIGDTSDEDAEDAPYDEVDDETDVASMEAETGEAADDINNTDAEPFPAAGERVAVEEVADETHEPRYNLRPNRGRSYGHRLDHIMDDSNDPKTYERQFQFLLQDGFSSQDPMQVVGPLVHDFLLTQMTASRGIKKHGQRAVDALFQEFGQLDKKTVFEPQHARDLTKEQKKEALRAINLIKEKRDESLKGRSCADGSTQRNKYPKEQTASPTVSNDALMLSIMVDSLEERDVATADVVGAYLLADMDEYTLLKLSGEAVDILCKVNSRYEQFVTMEHGQRVLYLKLLKALYGCVRSALLWYQLFVGTLERIGFKLNPYDLCIANKLVEGKQCTIGWHVDDMKISHVNCNVVSDIINLLELEFGKMSVTRGKEHTFLRMVVTYNDNRTASISMKGYLQEAISEFGEDCTKRAATPAKKDLFNVDINLPRLGEAQKARFHSIVAKLLYVCKRGRPDIQLAIMFLCTRVSRSTKEDWGKLRRVLQYINGTIDEVLTIGADTMGVLQTWVDASYGVHADMRSHTGGLMSFGLGAVCCKSSKQKLNTKSSTEAELVGASDYLPHTIWTRMFLLEQGYAIEENIFAQDNQSAMKLEKNGRTSCGQKSRHIDIRYFFMKDRITSEHITVVYCPTGQMLADFFTKPLQGALFVRFKRIIMGQEHIRTIQTVSSPIEERVEVKFLELRKPDINWTQTSVDDRQRSGKVKERASTQVRGRSYEATEIGTLSASNGEQHHARGGETL